MADNNQLGTEGGNSQEMMKFLIMMIASVVIMLIVSIVINYVVVENIITQKLSTIQINSEEVGEEDESDEIQKGIIVDLGDFILNLCDENAKKFLKVNVAIEVSKKEDDFPKEEAKSGGGGHGHGESAPAPDPLAAIQTEMNQYKPAIRDAVITNLSSKTSAELATAAGKELAKEQITNDINSILGGEREVLRVSFGQFIIQ